MQAYMFKCLLSMTNESECRNRKKKSKKKKTNTKFYFKVIMNARRYNALVSDGILLKWRQEIKI